MEILTKVKEALINRFVELVKVLPDIIIGILLLIVVWIVAKIIRNVIYKILIVVKIDNLGDYLRRVSLFSHFNFKFSKLISDGVYWLIMTVIILETSRAMGLHSVANGISGFIAYMPTLLSSILFFIIGVFIANVIKEIIETASESMSIGAGRVLANLIFYFLVVIIAITAVNQTGIDTEILSQNVTILIGAIFFAIALGYAIASKDLMANMLGSFYGKGKFMVGQTIRIEGIQGKIISMDSTSAVLESGDKKIVVPLAKLSSAMVEIL